MRTPMRALTATADPPAPRRWWPGPGASPLAGAPNAGKTSIYNALTGLHAKTGNYPGVTVQRSLGTCKIGNTTLTIEDLPGAYSLDPISPDEQVVRDVLTDASETVSVPDALVVVIDATTLRRGMNFVAEALALDLPTCLVVTMTDELTRRSGRLDVAALGQALGIPGRTGGRQSRHRPSRAARAPHRGRRLAAPTFGSSDDAQRSRLLGRLDPGRRRL